MPRAVPLCLFLVTATGLTQTPPAPTFDVAAIKPMKIGDTGVHWRDGNGSVSMKNMSVRDIIIAAYRIQEAQYSGPAWTAADRYTIEAKTTTKVPDEQLMPMMQLLLADRFKLLTHRETKPVSGYALVAAKGGIKMKPAEGEDSSSHGSANKLTASAMDMPRFARWVSRALGQPVIDGTHESRRFDFTLEYAREVRARPDAAPDPDPNASALPTLFTALPEQLGLKLEARKVPVEFLIVDRVERPAEN